MRITSYTVNHRLATAAIVVSLLFLGLYGLWRLPVDLLPSITYPLVRVSISWRGVPPQEVEQGIADPVERVMSTVDGLDYLESISFEGLYNLWVNFRPGTDINIAYQDVLAALNRVERNLPVDIEPPVVFKADPSQLPVAQIAVSSDTWDPVKLRSWADRWLQDKLVTVSGVAGTEIIGGMVREIRVELDPDMLTKHKLSLGMLVRKLKDENVELAAGRVVAGDNEIIARTVAEYTSLNELKNLIVARSGSAVVRLRDIANVSDSHEEVRMITRLDGLSCVTVSVLKQADANTAAVAKNVMRRIDEMDDILPSGVRFATVEDQSVYVQSAINGVRDAAIQAALLMVVVVFVFLGSFRQVIVMAISLPMILIVNFAFMKLAGFSLNIFSLGGLVVAIGVLLDNSIVVVENATRLTKKSEKQNRSQTVIEATSEVGPAVLAAMITFLALFLPFLMIPGMTSLLMRELILVIAGVSVISLIMALTVTPMLIAWFGSRSKKVSGINTFDRMHQRLSDIYIMTLHNVVNHPVITISSFGIITAAAIYLLPFVGSEFLPKMDDGRIMAKVKLPSGASITRTSEALKKIEKAVKGDSLIQSVFSIAGGRPQGQITYEVANEGQVDIQLVDRKRRNISTEEYLKKIRPKINKLLIPGARIMLMHKSVRGIHGMGKSDIEVKIRGTEFRTLFTNAQRMAESMRSLDNLTNVVVTSDMQKPEYRLLIDRERASLLGVTASQVSSAARSFINGTIATRYREENEYYDIRVVAPSNTVAGEQDIGNLLVDLPDNGHARIYDVAKVVESSGPVEIARENQSMQVVIQADVDGSNIGATLELLKSRLEETGLPSGYSIAYGGQAPLMQQMQQAMVWIILFALFFAFVVLTVQFNNLRLPAMVLISIPFCLAGVVFAFLMTGTPLSVTALVGLILVMAAAVNDGVLLFTFADELQVKEKFNKSKALVEAARIRFRPRIMTTITTLAGLIPLAIGAQTGIDLLRPMAVCAIGGLIFEMAVALFLMPVFYVFTAKNGN